jgi:iron complex outermembrane receptor protein
VAAPPDAGDFANESGAGMGGMSNMDAPGICVTMVCSLAAGLILAAVPAGAQEQDDGTSSGSPRLIDEVVVTARKKEENLQDVPIAITSLSQEDMQRAGITSLAGVAAFTPGLTFSNLFGEFLPVPVIRGVAPTAIFGENNVAVFVDGVFVAGREGLNASQLDLARIEVLKGPQSTKYGRNAFAGAINYVTARPGDELEGQAQFTVGNYDRRRARLMLSGPLVSGKLAGRISVGIDEWSGSYDNALSNLDIGGYQYKTLQTSLWWTPSDAWDIQWALYLSDDEIDDSARSTVPANCEDRQDLQTQGIAPPLPPDADNGDWSDGPRPQNYCGTLAALPDNVLAINDQSTGEERELVRSSLNVNWDFGFGSIASLTGYSSTEQVARSDSNQMPPGTFKPDGSPRPAGTVPYYYTIAGGGVDEFDAELTTVGLGDETVEWSQELRFSTPLDKAVRMDLGGYWYSVQAEGGYTDFTARMTGDSGQRLPADFAGMFPGAGVVGDAIFVPRFENSVDNIVPPGDVREDLWQDTQSWSVFSEFEFDFGDGWTFDIGGRYINDYHRLSVVEIDQWPEKTIDETRRFDYGTGRAGLRYFISDENMIYTSISNGKKSGGMDLISGDVICPAGTVCPDGSTDPINDQVIPVRSVTDFDIEEITAFEIGNKGTIWDGRARYDLAVYYNDWRNILMPQILDTDPESGLPFEQPESVDLTGGDATTWGGEISLGVVLAENWDMSLGGSYTQAEYKDAELASFRLFPSFWNDTDGDGRGDNADISGKELLRQSKWQGNATLNYVKPLDTQSLNDQWSFYSRTDVLYTGAQWVGAANQAEVPDFTDVNQRFGLESDKVRVEFWIENLFDNDLPRAAFRDVTFNNTHLQLPAYGGFSDMFPFRVSASHPIRRTFGVSAFVNF